MFDDIFSRLDTVHQGDGRTDTGRQQRPRLRIAFRGKNGRTDRQSFIPSGKVVVLVF